MQERITRQQALDLLRKYNKEPFHIQHALTVEGVMDWYARELGYGDDAPFWSMVGLLHDIDFEQWPEEHCKKAPELLEAAGLSPAFIHARWRRCSLPPTSSPDSSAPRSGCVPAGASPIWRSPA